MNCNDTSERAYSTEPPRPWTDVSFTQLMSFMKSGDIRLFDVRSKKEVKETGMIPEATHMPLTEVAEAFELTAEKFKLRYGVEKPSRRYRYLIFYCSPGRQSSEAVDIVQEAGYYIARRYPGGWEEYDQLKNVEDYDALKPWTDLSFEELMSKIKSKDIQLFDVRRIEEIESTGIMPGAAHIPSTDVEVGCLGLGEWIRFTEENRFLIECFPMTKVAMLLLHFTNSILRKNAA